jgi:inner membrane protein involved in colicin E2 resistance
MYDSLNTAFQKSSDFSEKVMEPMLDKGILSYNQATKEEKKYTILFIALNLIGTLLFALYHIIPQKE